MSHNELALRLHLYLMGPPRVILGGAPVAGFRSSKAQALLYYLAVAANSVRRTTLSALLWPEFDDRQAGASLRNALSNLRSLLGDHLATTRESAALYGEAIWSDVAQFDALLKRTGDNQTDIVQMEAAVSLYQGDFLEGFHVADAPEFEQWATIERERLREATLNGLLTLADWHESQTDYASALDDLTRLLAIDPANEQGHRQKMTALARMGRRNAALQEYDICRRVLAEDLGVDPSPQTIAVYELILAGALETPAQTRGATPDETTPAARPQPLPAPEPTTLAPKRPYLDQRDMPERILFHGRQEDLEQVGRWLSTDDARLVAISGMGGVGKTALAVEHVARLAPGSFEIVIWRSLVNAPPLDLVLDAWLQILAGQRLDRTPDTIDEKLAMLFDEMQRRRCLLILDNLESLIEPGHAAGSFRGGYEEYDRLIEVMGSSRHRSCLLVTTRDLPPRLRTLEEDTPGVRIMRLEGLSAGPACELLRERGVSAPDAVLANLAKRYSGNPLALKLVADTVRDLFANDVKAFLGDETPVFDDIRRVLDEQYSRLTELGREVVLWLAVERRPVTVQTLWQDLARRPRRAEFLDVIRSLQNGSMVEVRAGESPDQPTLLALQNVVMEYLTERLVTTLSAEVEQEQLDWLHRYALVKVQSRQHVQQSQRRVLLEPMARKLVDAYGRYGAVEHLRDVLAVLRQGAAQKPGYAAADILHLLLYLEADLKGWDFDGLAVWQADLRTPSLAGVSLRATDLTGSAFLQTFGAVRAIGISPNGRYLAAGDGDGSAYVWQMPGFRLHRVLRGHTQSIASLAFSPDSTALATGGFEGRVCIWDAATGETLHTLPAHSGSVGGVAFSRDGKYLVSGGADAMLVIWDWRSGQHVARFQDAASVDSVTFLPDGHRVVAAKDDSSASVWDWRRSAILATLSGHTDKIRCVACSPDGTVVATGGEDNRICLWRLDRPAEPRVLDGHRGWIWSLAFSPDGQSLASASADGTVRLWDLRTGEIRRTMLGHTSWAVAVACSPDGTTIASGGYDQTVRLWDERSGLALRSFHGYKRGIDFVCFSREGGVLASSSLDGPIHLWDVRSKTHIRRLTGHRRAIRAVAVSEANRLVVGGSDDHGAYLWDMDTGRLRERLQVHKDRVRHVAFSADGQYLVTGSADRTLGIWHAASCRLIHLVSGAIAKIHFATAFADEGRILAYGAEDSSVKLLDIRSGDTIQRLPIAQDRPTVVAFNPRRQLLACGTEGGAVWVWQLNAGREEVLAELLFRSQPTDREIWRILFSPDGRLLAVCADRGDRPVLDTESGQLAYSLPHVLGAFDVTFAGEGGYLTTVGLDRDIRIRDADTGAVRRTLKGHSAEVLTLDASPADNLVASGSVDGSVRLWDSETGDCQAILVPDGPYAGMNIAGATGITAAQRSTLINLGAIEG